MALARPEPIVVVILDSARGGHDMDDSTHDVQNPGAEGEPSKERTWRDWMMGAVGVTGVMSVLAIILSLVAISSTSGNGNGAAQAAASAVPASAPAAAPGPAAVKLVVKSDSEHSRKGPDGTWHDAYLPANFAVRAGQTVSVTVYNYDTGTHTFTAPSLGINAVIPAGTDKAAHKVTFKFTAPSQPGSYQWWCSTPCDPWAMSEQGFMQGTVTVRA